MKTKKHFSTSGLVKLTGLFLLTVSLFASFSCNENSKSAGISGDEMIVPPPLPPDAPSPPPAPAYTLEKGDTIWIEVDAMPEFPGGEAEILNFIVRNTAYPASAKTKGIQGRVIVSFIVDEAGKAGSAKIISSVDPEIDAEALRVINSLPEFEKPAIKNGKPVRVWFSVPITFALK